MRTDQELRRDVLAELDWQPALRDEEIGVAVKDGEPRRPRARSTHETRAGLRPERQAWGRCSRDFARMFSTPICLFPAWHLPEEDFSAQERLHVIA
jgi:hypothetical protein